MKIKHDNTIIEVVVVYHQNKYFGIALNSPDGISFWRLKETSRKKFNISPEEKMKFTYSNDTSHNIRIYDDIDLLQALKSPKPEIIVHTSETAERERYSVQTGIWSVDWCLILCALWTFICNWIKAL